MDQIYRVPFEGSEEDAGMFVEHLRTELPPELNLSTADVERDGMLRLRFDPGLTEAAKLAVTAAVERTTRTLSERGLLVSDGQEG